VSSRAYSIAVIGGGIVGLATARAICGRGATSLVLLEAEDRLAAHQTGHNSGVIHSGLYYRPGSLKARNCAGGREALYRYCRDRGIPHAACGKLVVATDEAEVARLGELERRGRENGLTGCRRIDAAELREREPHAGGLAALWVPQTGVVDFSRVAAALGGELEAAGAEVRTRERVLAVGRGSGEFVLRTSAAELRARNLVNCAGLQSDRVARLCGLRPDVRIVPFRGAYRELVPERRGLVRGLIYPVPDPRLPFLGVHLTRRVDGRVEAGPNAVLALHREGYGRLRASARDVLACLAWPGFWRMARRLWRTGLDEARRSIGKAGLLHAARRLVPELDAADFGRSGAGVRAQAVARDGTLVDDFHLLEAEHMLHVLNAPSPAATASLSLGEFLAEKALRSFRP
jgi:L-2-hydroxyglutarate oxidase